MLEHASGLFIKVSFIQDKFWKTHENSICFTKNI